MIGAFLPDGRLHLQHGPIDLVIETFGEASEVRAAYRQAAERFGDILPTLVRELPTLRRPLGDAYPLLQGPVARRMAAAVWPYRDVYITPMAAVAGAVAEEILSTMREAAPLRRAYVNNGGDIALHLAQGATFTVALMDRPDSQGVLRTMTIRAEDAVRGVATSGRHGRSFSLGIADAVTVLARTAAQADAAATIVANAVDLPGHPAIIRQPACEIQSESDLSDRLVTRAVGALDGNEIAAALAAGDARAQALLAAGLIEGAVLQLCGALHVIGARQLDIVRPQLRAEAA